MYTLDLSVELGPLRLRNPILLASGTCGYGIDLAGLLDLSIPAGFVSKGISVEARSGNPPPRIAETPSGMLNAIGLENVGLAAFINEKLPRIRALPLACIVNVYGNTFEEYATLCEELGDRRGVAGVELNLSCPNVSRGGVEFGQDPKMLARLVSLVRPKVRSALLVKLSPNVADIQPFVRAAQSGGADAVSLINTVRGMEVDIHSRRPLLGNVTGGLSGPAIRPIALYHVFCAAKIARVPLVGIGGIDTWADVVRFLLAGASAVQVGTALFRDPTAPGAMVGGLREYLAAHKDTAVSQIVGQACRAVDAVG